MTISTFPRKHRLTRPEEFRRVFARSAQSRDRCFRVLARRNDLGFDRLGLAISKRVCPAAAGRNRLKRLVRESFRTRAERPLGAAGLDLVVLAQPPAAGTGNAELFKSLRDHWRRIASRVAEQERKHD